MDLVTIVKSDNRLRINIDFAIFLNPFLCYCHGTYV